ncbi:hypothetical protein MZO42_05470 [Sphingomonas psychrotolerans]|uniref:Uncharacterized protein n=1 Tax=Sphingomonas psychrotolerans TaxID=1327635 RepID=A0ABU3N1M9_9SPHN|nr:hypothetical protein [Sphingomonas psychrotolerans]MDT8758141.1 hypothetical protein [Sphingomonas psychrotolerans]
MGNLDVPKVIEAAATSNLGVLSLLVLVLAFLAWRFFQSSGDKVKLAAFGLMFVGAVGFGSSVMLAGSGATPAPSRPADTPGPAAAPTPTPSPESSATIAIGAPPTEAADIAGGWHDSDRYRYAFRQNGNRFSYVSTLDGERTSSGEGTIAGDRLRYAYRNEATADSGTCTGKISPDRQSIDGKCGNGTDEWGFRIERDAKRGGAKD